MILNIQEMDEIANSGHLKNESKDLINELFSFFNSFKDCVIQDFFIGISDMPETKVFTQHRVNPCDKRFIIANAQCSEIANEVKNTLLKFGINGSPEISQGKYVYCYYIDGYTREIT